MPESLRFGDIYIKHTKGKFKSVDLCMIVDAVLWVHTSTASTKELLLHFETWN